VNLRYVLRRLAQAAVTMVGIVVVTFVLIQMAPGDAVDALAAESEAGPEYVARLRADLRLDRPLIEQLATYTGRLLRGDLGESLVVQWGSSVTDLIVE
jgi:peptide/nickel transport system permease protein